MPKTSISIICPSVTACFLVVTLASLPGCGAGNELGRLTISGAVTLDGAPLDQGSIEFSPHQLDGITSGAIITDGAYIISTDDGLPPGKYLVRIFSPVEAKSTRSEPSVPGPTIPGSVGPSQPPPGVERIPSAYNTESKQIVEVKQDAVNTFNFVIQSK